MTDRRKGWSNIIGNEIELAREKKKAREREKAEKEVFKKILEEAKKLD